MHHLTDLVEKVSEMPGTHFRFEVVELWVFGDLLGVPRDLEHIDVALVTDLPVDEVPWLTEPLGAEHWANASRVSRNPVVPFWRSAGAPVWNHRIERPALAWSRAGGIAEETLVAVSDGSGELVRLPAPEPDELRKRLDDEFALSLAAMRHDNQVYTDRRWSPGKLTPHADALWRSTTGYLDLLDALDRLSSGAALGPS